MAKPEFCYLYLTCKDVSEASQIAETLLNKRLIVCAKQTSVDSNYVWKSMVERSQEILLIMESSLQLFDAVEREVAKIHSYETFVLEAVPIAKVSAEAIIWMKENLDDGTN